MLYTYPVVEGVSVDDTDCQFEDNFMNLYKSESEEGGWILEVHIVNFPKLIQQSYKLQKQLQTQLKKSYKSQPGTTVDRLIFDKNTLSNLYDKKNLPCVTLRVEFDSEYNIVDSSVMESRFDYQNTRSYEFSDLARIMEVDPQFHGEKERMLLDLYELAKALIRKRSVTAICGMTEAEEFFDWTHNHKRYELDPGSFMVREIRLWADAELTRIANMIDCPMIITKQKVKDLKLYREMKSFVPDLMSGQPLLPAIKDHYLDECRSLLEWHEVLFRTVSFMGTSTKHIGYGFDCYASFLAPRRKLMDLVNLSLLLDAEGIMVPPFHKTSVKSMTNRIKKGQDVYKYPE